MGRSLDRPGVVQLQRARHRQHGGARALRHARAEAQWLAPLLAGEIRSAFAMTEPDVASSDATNIEASIVRDGDHYVINGRKWWTTGGPDPRCRILIFMGKTDPANPDRHRQQSMILVPIDTPGVTIVRALPVFGYDDAPHGHAEFHVRRRARAGGQHPARAKGRGFEIAQGRLGPGRIHHCMRLIGLAERALELLCARAAHASRSAADLGADGHAGAHRERAHRDRPGAPARAARRVEDGHGGQQGGAARRSR